MCPRPKEFDPDKALDAAMKLFWRKGYEATSVQDLVEAMGINRFSLYDTYGDKHSLYLQACEKYRNRMESRLIRQLEQSESGLAGIHRFFHELEDWYSPKQARRGCMMVNSIVEKAPDDVQIRRHGQKFLKRLESAFEASLRRASSAGEIGTKTNPVELAQFLTGQVQAVGVVGKAFADRNRVRTVIRVALNSLTQG